MRLRFVWPVVYLFFIIMICIQAKEWALHAPPPLTVSLHREVSSAQCSVLSPYSVHINAHKWVNKCQYIGSIAAFFSLSLSLCLLSLSLSVSMWRAHVVFVLKSMYSLPSCATQPPWPFIWVQRQPFLTQMNVFLWKSRNGCHFSWHGRETNKTPYSFKEAGAGASHRTQTLQSQKHK